MSITGPVSPPAVAPQLGSPVIEHLGGMMREMFSPPPRSSQPEEVRALLQRLVDALLARGDRLDPRLEQELLKTLPSLHAFALSLASNHTTAEDLVQGTVLKAWRSIHRFEPGTNLHAWLFTILRNQFFSSYRKTKNEQEDPGEVHALKLSVPPNQLHSIAVQELRAALARLTEDQRTSLLLVAADGLSYEEAAEVMGVAVGTVKSRVNRARTSLASLMGIEGRDDLGADATLKAALA